MTTSNHDAVEVIVAKRDRGELSDSQIDWVVDAYTRGEVADEQMSALAMAILLNGMTRREIARWTGAMIASGERMDFSTLSCPTADKHSTGGVGDKITLPVAPLVAACGRRRAPAVGRGLGVTGGTIDKLEFIPAVRHRSLRGRVRVGAARTWGRGLPRRRRTWPPPTRSSTRCAT